MTIAVAVGLLVACGGPRYHSTRGARVVEFTLHSKLVGQDLHEVLVLPRDAGRWMLFLLHGYHSSPSQFLSQQFFDTLAALRARAPDVLLLDGGADSYWHDRADGKWGSMVLDEAIPAGLHRTGAKRIAIGGISMGGYGALLAGSRDRHFCATAVMSPALWLRTGETAPGAFDNADDYERNDVFELRPPHPLWIALGASDPFRVAALAYAQRAGAHAHVSQGGHDSAFWDAHIGALLRFVARACA